MRAKNSSPSLNVSRGQELSHFRGLAEDGRHGLIAVEKVDGSAGEVCLRKEVGTGIG